MRGYTEITTQAELDAFVETIEYLDDSILKEIHILNTGYVLEEDRSMSTGSGFDVQMIYQSQFIDHDIEIVLYGVGYFEPLSWCKDHNDLKECSIREKRTSPEREVRFDGIVAARLFYRLLPKTGRKAILGPELPQPDAPPATIIEPGWRMCQHCISAWQEDESIIFARCPKCGHLTELAE